jgi:hypothetical protein
MRAPLRLSLVTVAATVALTACGDDDLVKVEKKRPPAPEQGEPIVEDPAEPEPEPPVEEEPAPPESSGEECASNDDCGTGSECEAGVCVGVGVLQVTLTFPGVDADYDLHVMTPSGSEIYFANTSVDGGVLDVDQCISSCGDGEHVENIFFNGALLSGPYEAWVVNFDGRDGGAFRIEVSGRTEAVLDGALDAWPFEESNPLFFTVE